MHRLIFSVALAAALGGCCRSSDVDYCSRARFAARNDAVAATLFCKPPYSIDDAWQERDPFRVDTWNECYDEVYMIVYDHYHAVHCEGDTGSTDTGT